MRVLQVNCNCVQLTVARLIKFIPCTVRHSRWQLQLQLLLQLPMPMQLQLPRSNILLLLAAITQCQDKAMGTVNLFICLSSPQSTAHFNPLMPP